MSTQNELEMDVMIVQIFAILDHHADLQCWIMVDPIGSVRLIILNKLINMSLDYFLYWSFQYVHVYGLSNIEYIFDRGFSVLIYMTHQADLVDSNISCATWNSKMDCPLVNVFTLYQYILQSNSHILDDILIYMIFNYNLQNKNIHGRIYSEGF